MAADLDDLDDPEVQDQIDQQDAPPPPRQKPAGRVIPPLRIFKNKNPQQQQPAPMAPPVVGDAGIKVAIEGEPSASFAGILEKPLLGFPIKWWLIAGGVYWFVVRPYLQSRED